MQLLLNLLIDKFNLHLPMDFPIFCVFLLEMTPTRRPFILVSSNACMYAMRSESRCRSEEIGTEIIVKTSELRDSSAYSMSCATEELVVVR